MAVTSLDIRALYTLALVQGVRMLLGGARSGVAKGIAQAEWGMVEARF